LNGNIYPSELGYYYNALQSLQTMAGELHIQLTRTLSPSFLKVVVLDFSNQPVIQTDSTEQTTTNKCASNNNAGINEQDCEVTESTTIMSKLDQIFSTSISKKTFSIFLLTAQTSSSITMINTRARVEDTSDATSIGLVTNLYSTTEDTSNDASSITTTTRNSLSKSKHISDTKSVSTSNIRYQTGTESFLTSRNTQKNTFSTEISPSILTTIGEMSKIPMKTSSTDSSSLWSRFTGIHDRLSPLEVKKQTSWDKKSIKNSDSTDTSSTVSYSSLSSSFDISSTLSSLFSSFLSIQSTSFQRTTTTSANPKKCDISDESSIQLSLIFLKVIIYFNTTAEENVTKDNITNSLLQYSPNVVLITECNTPSSNAASFNVTKSIIESPIPFYGNISSILAQDTINDSLANSLASITPPSLLTSLPYNQTMTTIATNFTNVTNSTMS